MRGTKINHKRRTQASKIHSKSQRMFKNKRAKTVKHKLCIGFGSSWGLEMLACGRGERSRGKAMWGRVGSSGEGVRITRYWKVDAESSGKGGDIEGGGGFTLLIIRTAHHTMKLPPKNSFGESHSKGLRRL